LLDGVVAGVWHAKRAGGVVAITVEPLVSLAHQHQSQLGAEAERIADFLELRLELSTGTIGVGPHT
jgi:hypothetical protein